MKREPDEEVNLALDLAALCESTHSLPRTGGVLDQDPYHLVLLRAGLYGLNKRKEFEQQKANQRRH